MESYRAKIIKKIIDSPDTLSVESIVGDSIQRLINNGTHVIFVLRIIDKLKTKLEKSRRGNLSELEKNNLIRALDVLRDYDAKKLTGTVKNK